MKQTLIYSFLLLSLACLWGCADDRYPGAQISPYFSMYDLRYLYKGEDVTLTKEKMFGSDKLTGVVVSDHSGGNLPEGLLCIQDARRIGLVPALMIGLVGSIGCELLSGVDDLEVRDADAGSSVGASNL